MRILGVSAVCPPITGGLEKDVQIFAHGLAAAGYTVAVAVARLAHDDPPAVGTDCTVDIYRIGGWINARGHSTSAQNDSLSPRGLTLEC
jgi:hypothetical protein